MRKILFGHSSLSDRSFSRFKVLDRFDNRFSQTLVRTVEFASVATDAGRHCVCRLGNMRTLTAPPPA